MNRLAAVRKGLMLLALVVMMLVFWSSTMQQRARTPSISGEMRVVVPWFVQVLLAGGDRYLGADLSVFRALIVSTDKLDADNYKVLAKVQKDAAFLNPRHEDNYYLAAAVLPWNGEQVASQEILAAAVGARPFDPLPPFYYGFGLYYFDKRPTDGALWLQEAARRESDVQNQYAYENLAARWFEKGSEPSVAANIVEAMAKQSRDPAFSKYLHLRAERLRMLDSLQVAFERFKLEQGRYPESFDELLEGQYISMLPKDPFGFGYRIGADGLPMLLNAKR